MYVVMAIVARIPIMRTTTINSIRVNPFSVFLFLISGNIFSFIIFVSGFCDFCRNW